MKTIKKQSKKLALLCVLLMLIQSCVVYGPPIELTEAVKQIQKTRVKYQNDEIYRFQYLVQENANYYGVEKKKGQITKTQIDINRIENIRTFNKSRSVTVSVLTPIVIVGGVYVIAVATWSGPSFSWN